MDALLVDNDPHVMLGLGQVQGRAFPVGGGGGEIRQPGLEHISDAQGPHPSPRSIWEATSNLGTARLMSRSFCWAQVL